MELRHYPRLEATLWDIANTLRGKMSADDFRDYILGFIFFKYLSEKMETLRGRDPGPGRHDVRRD